MLILTRKAGESVKVGEYMVSVLRSPSLFDRRACHVEVVGLTDRMLLVGGAGIHFAGGVLKLSAIKRPGQATLSFDFPKDVRVVRTELIKC